LIGLASAFRDNSSSLTGVNVFKISRNGGVFTNDLHFSNVVLLEAGVSDVCAFIVEGAKPIINRQIIFFMVAYLLLKLNKNYWILEIISNQI
jgi:hypothetical protein